MSVALVLHTTLSKTIGKLGCHLSLPDKSTYGLIFFMHSRPIDNADFLRDICSLYGRVQ